MRINEVYLAIRRVAPHKRLMTRGDNDKKEKLRTKQKLVSAAEDILEEYQQRTKKGQGMQDFILFQLRDLS